jgi:hypothetical protein
MYFYGQMHSAGYNNLNSFMMSTPSWVNIDGYKPPSLVQVLIDASFTIAPFYKTNKTTRIEHEKEQQKQTMSSIDQESIPRPKVTRRYKADKDYGDTEHRGAAFSFGAPKVWTRPTRTKGAR